MTFRDALRAEMAASDLSMRALSLKAGLNPKAVSDILTRPDLRPTQKTIAALSTALGTSLPVPEAGTSETYAELINRRTDSAHSEEARKSAKRIQSRLRWLLRKAGWVAETKSVDRQEVIDFFAANRPATFDLTPGSYATYKSEILDAIGTRSASPRVKGIREIDGLYAEIHNRIKNSGLPLDLKNTSGAFLVWLHDNAVAPSEITTATLETYFVHRLNVARKPEETCRKHVKRVATLLEKLNRDRDFADYRFAAPDHPFGDHRDKYGIADSAIAALMEEFDRRVVPWVRGEVSNTGLTREEFVAELDRRRPEATDHKKAALRKRRKERGRESACQSRDEAMKARGFLLADEVWSDTTLANRRAFVAAAAKAMLAETDVLIETLEELTDPEIADEVACTLSEINEGEYTSSYVETGLKALRKIATHLLCRPPEDIVKFDEIISEHRSTDRGIAPRNREKLRRFTEDKLNAIYGLSTDLLLELNREIKQRRRSAKRKTGSTPPDRELFDPALAQKVMLTLAHDIMIKRAPRKSNLVGIRVDWIRWREDLATVVVPARFVKGRGHGDADLPIPLDQEESQLLRKYLEVIRPSVLGPNDAQNPYLFPSQDYGRRKTNQPYRNILGRLCKEIHARVGILINPHLYRHLIGWSWLREDPDKLPAVQKLLGHKSLQTTLDYYAELDENLALDTWQEYINARKKRSRRPPRAAA